MSLSAALDAAGLHAKMMRTEARRLLAIPQPPTHFGGLDETVIDRATIWPWIVRAYCELPDGRRKLVGTVLAAHDEPSIVDYIPDDAVGVLWARVYRATRFDDMPEAERRAFTADYRAYLHFRKARALGVEVEALRPWIDYDPILIDGAIDRWVKTGVAR